MDDVTVGAWAARWLASRTDLKPRTQVAYEGIVRTRVVPVFGARWLRGLRPMELQEWVAAMQREGLSPSWVRECANLVTAVLEDAVHEGLLERNPASRLRRPRVARPEVQLTAGGSRCADRGLAGGAGTHSWIRLCRSMTLAAEGGTARAGSFASGAMVARVAC